MEAFKAVEKEMKTKAFSKEGLLVSAKQDPKEQEKDEMRTFLGDMVDEIGRQIEEDEAEAVSLRAQSKKKKDPAKAERITDLETQAERHKWHQNKLELLMRAMANDDVDVDQVKEKQEDIQYYVDNNREVDFFEDESIYDDFNLDEDGDKYGVHQDLDKVPSQDNQDIQDEPDTAPAADAAKGKAKAAPDAASSTRRPSQQIKSPLPALASLHNLPTATPASVNPPPPSNMKPAPPPSKPPGEMLNYRSAAAAGAANDTGIGIGQLPTLPGKVTPSGASATPAAAPEPTVKSSATTSPAVSTAQPASTSDGKPTVPAQAKEQPLARTISRSPAPGQTSVGQSPAVTAAQLAQASARDTAPTLPQQNGVSRQEALKREPPSGQSHDRMASLSSRDTSSPLAQANGIHAVQSQEDESVYHLPSSLQELVDCFEDVRTNAPPVASPEHQRILDESFSRRPDVFEAEKARHYKPEKPVTFTPSHYPKDPLPIFDDPRLYSRVDQDALFYSFYYRQGTYQQYLAAKELKATSWRFHKQYQTWFQRHEEPQSITEDSERGTYRFFDYESTWYVSSSLLKLVELLTDKFHRMNRRKADFEFKYRFLEDEVL